MKEPMLTPDDMAEILRLPSTKALYQMLDRHPNQLPKPLRVGRLLRWTQSSVDTWLQQ